MVSEHKNSKSMEATEKPARKAMKILLYSSPSSSPQSTFKKIETFGPLTGHLLRFAQQILPDAPEGFTFHFVSDGEEITICDEEISLSEVLEEYSQCSLVVREIRPKDSKDLVKKEEDDQLTEEREKKKKKKKKKSKKDKKDRKERKDEVVKLEEKVESPRSHSKRSINGSLNGSANSSTNGEGSALPVENKKSQLRQVHSHSRSKRTLSRPAKRVRRRASSDIESEGSDAVDGDAGYRDGSHISNDDDEDDDDLRYNYRREELSVSTQDTESGATSGSDSAQYHVKRKKKNSTNLPAELLPFNQPGLEDQLEEQLESHPMVYPVVGTQLAQMTSLDDVFSTLFCDLLYSPVPTDKFYPSFAASERKYFSRALSDLIQQMNTKTISPSALASFIKSCFFQPDMMNLRGAFQPLVPQCQKLRELYSLVKPDVGDNTFERHCERYLDLYMGGNQFELNTFRTPPMPPATATTNTTDPKTLPPLRGPYGLYATAQMNRGDKLALLHGLDCLLSPSEGLYIEQEQRLVNPSSQPGMIDVIEIQDFRKNLSAGTLVGPLRFLRHDCKPNVESLVLKTRSFEKMIRVVRRVEVGEELTVRNGAGYKDRKFHGSCGRCKSCRESLQLLALHAPSKKVSSKSLRKRRKTSSHSFCELSDDELDPGERRIKRVQMLEQGAFKSCFVCKSVLEESMGLKCGKCERHRHIYGLEWPGKSKISKLKF